MYWCFLRLDVIGPTIFLSLLPFLWLLVDLSSFVSFTYILETADYLSPDFAEKRIHSFKKISPCCFGVFFRRREGKWLIFVIIFSPGPVRRVFSSTNRVYYTAYTWLLRNLYNLQDICYSLFFPTNKNRCLFLSIKVHQHFNWPKTNSIVFFHCNKCYFCP